MLNEKQIDDFKVNFSKMATNELARIVSIDRNDYLDDVIKLVEDELQSRGVNKSQINEILSKKEIASKDNRNNNNSVQKVVKLILIVILALYGFYVIGRDLFSGEFYKTICVVIGIPLVWWISKRG